MPEHKREKTIAALILAAGCSSRLQCGQESYHKLLLPLGEGTILSHVIAMTLASQARPIVLILGHQSAQIRAGLTRAGASPASTDDITINNTAGTGPAYMGDILIIENTVYAQGMSTSLHKGIQFLLDQNNYSKHLGTLCNSKHSDTLCDGALVLLGDQPLITSALLDQLIEMKYATGKRIVAPFYEGQRRNPVLFDADLFPELLTTTGDEGGRSVIAKYHTEVGMLKIDDSQLCYDVDTWDAYQEVLHIWQQQQK
jgi:molybdenum cofactor cytidylyltransferase